MNHKPCAECPFRKTSLKGYVGGHEDAIEIYDLLSVDRKFPCHMQVTDIKNHLLNELGDDGEDPLSMSDDAAFEQACEEAPHCTGAILFLNNSCKRSRNPEIVKLQNAMPDKDDSVFQHLKDFLTYHNSKIFKAMGNMYLLPGMRADVMKPPKKKRVKTK